MKYILWNIWYAWKCIANWTSVHICTFARNQLRSISLRHFWELKMEELTSFVLKQSILNLLFMEMLKTAQIYTKNMEYFWSVSFRLLWCVYQLPKPVSKSTGINNNVMVEDIDLSGNPCTPDTNPPIVRLSVKQIQMSCLLFCLPKLVIARLLLQAIHTTMDLLTAGTFINNKSATWLAEGHVIALTHLEHSR